MRCFKADGDDAGSAQYGSLVKAADALINVELLFIRPAEGLIQ